MSFDYASQEYAERLVKSFDRVRDLGEVFTPSSTVQEMLDLLPKKIWSVHPSPTLTTGERRDFPLSTKEEIFLKSSPIKSERK